MERNIRRNRIKVTVFVSVQIMAEVRRVAEAAVVAP
jgi:hypothetical protein